MRCLFLVILVFLYSALYSQSEGDYQSKQSGNWNDEGTWQRYDGSGFVDVSTPPNATSGTITIKVGHNVTVNSTIAGGQVVISTGAILNWNGGALYSSINNAGTFNLNWVIDFGSNAVFNNNGIFNWTADFRFRGATFNNNTNGIVNANGNHGMGNWDGINSFNNSGLLTKQNGAGTTTIGIPWQNSGTVDIRTGEFSSSSTFTNTGVIKLAAGTTFVNNSNFNYNAGSQLSGTGTFSNNSVLILNTSLNLINTIVFNQLSGNIQGSLLTINGEINWNGGALYSSVTNAGTFNLNWVIDFGSNAVFNNNGIFNWTADFRFRGATFNNNTNGIVNANGNHGMGNWDGINSFNNSGLLTKQNGAGTTTIGIPWQNSGTVDIKTGEFSSSSTFTNTGVIKLAAGTTFVNNSNFNYNAGSQLSGTGTFSNNSVLILNTSLNLINTIVFNQLSGNIQGSLLTINGEINWNGGALYSSVTNAGTFNLNWVVDFGWNAVFNNNGIFNWTANFRFRGATFNNNATGIINANGNHGMENWDGINSFNNSGLLTKQNGAGTTTIGIPWQNSGTVDIKAGEFSLSSTFTNTGVVNLTAGTTLVNNNTFNSNAGSQLSGTGIFSNNGVLILNTGLSLINTIVFNQLSGNIQGSLLTINGEINWNGGTLLTHIINDGTFNLNSLFWFTSNATIENNRTFNLNGEIRFSGSGATFNNNASGVFNANNGYGMINWDGAGISKFNNLGVIIKHHNTSESHIGIPLQNLGTIKGVGTFNISSLSNSGIIEPGLSPGILQFTGAQPLAANSILQIEIQDETGPGNGHDQLSGNADLTLAGKLKILAGAEVPVGSYIIIQLSSGTISGIFSDMQLPPGFSIRVNPDNVVLDVEEVVVDTDNDGIADGEDCAPDDATRWRSALLYLDSDEDGYDNGQVTVCYGSNIPTGYTQTTNGTDCNDNNAEINPATIWYKDIDDDGFSDGTVLIQCEPPTGYKLAIQLIATIGDCNDDDPTIYPGAPELCDGKDNNCDGQVDEGYACGVPPDGTPCDDGIPCTVVDVYNNGVCAGTPYTQTYYFDADGDGFGNPDIAVQINPVCEQAGEGYVTEGGDCDDNDPTVYPGAPELLDGKDNDCNGQIDEGLGSIWYRDADGDGHGNAAITLQAHAQPAGYVSNNTDCNDDDSTIYPGAPELCDGKDNNCNGQTDEGIEKTIWYRDNDNDGYGDAINTLLSCLQPPGYVANNIDCDDNNSNINPGVVEVNGDGIDNDCNGLIDELVKWYRDADGDGYGNAESMLESYTEPAGYVSNNIDCNDNDPTIYPGAPELCDGKDNNCDGQVDEGYACGVPPDGTPCDDGIPCTAVDVYNNGVCAGTLYTQTYYFDADGDGFGNPDIAVQINPVCEQAGEGYVTEGGDCDDNDPTVYPGAPELLDGKDNDCNGQIDEGLGSIWYRDADGDGHGNAAITLQAHAQPAGYVSNNTDCNDDDSTIYPGAPELCDGKDNNCNGQTDEGIEKTIWYRDNDGDGYGDAETAILSCLQPSGYVANHTDCDDNNSNINPGVVEVNGDGIDNDCNGLIDELVKWYRDADGDGYGNAESMLESYTEPAGYVSNNIDCNDNDPTIYPGAPELCDGKDNNCDGQVDEGYACGVPPDGTPCDDGIPCTVVDVYNNGVCAGTLYTQTYYFDADGDGFGNPDIAVQINPVCEQAGEGYVTEGGDCDDNDPTVYPGAPELLDGKDNDCNGQIDEGLGSIWYRDADGDGHGNAAITLQAHAQPAGYVSNNTDCNDDDSTIYPGAPELCDGKDNNCNGQTDEGIEKTIWYRDNDGDGYGDAETAIQTCTQPASYVTNNTDCNDHDATIYPGAPELCDGKDNNCNGQTDEGVGSIWYQDNDGDGYGNAGVTIRACAQPTGYVSSNNDCNDGDATIYPGAPELCDGKDNNCNGTIDEGCGNLPAINILSTLNLEGNSGSRNMSFTLTLSRRSAVPVTVRYRTVDGSATAPEDYTAKSGTITFPANSISQTLNISIKGDTWYEASETFKVELFEPLNARLVNSKATATIVNDDLPPFVRIQDAQTTEQAQQVQIRIDLTAISRLPVMVRYETRNGTAKAPADFTAATNAIIRFEPGETTKYITIPIVWDAITESTEQFTVRILGAENASVFSLLNLIGARITSTVRIINSPLTNNRIAAPEEMELQSDEKTELVWRAKVQPNPFTNTFELALTTDTFEPVTIRIMDRAGRVVKTETHSWTGKPLRISSVDLNAGVYFGEVTQGNRRSVLRLMKL